MIFKKNAFFYLYALYLLAGAYLLYSLQKGDIVIWFNQHYSSSGDVFFKFFTHVGDGLFFIALIIVMLFVNYFRAFIGVLTYASSSLFTQALKHGLFSDMERPSGIIDHSLLHPVEGVDWHCCHSFPSGHSTSAFAMFVWLSLYTQNRILQAFFFTCALVVTFSRMYLSQHFFMDTYVGSLIGSTFALLTFSLLNKTSWASNEKWNSKLI
jgi:membrane-associated phospholipid phosphatase